MQIVFYNNTAEMERVDKTNYLNKNFEIFGYLCLAERRDSNNCCDFSVL